MDKGELASRTLALAERVTREICAAIPDQVEAVALFGSAARGTARAGSDLDLLVVLRAPPRSYSKRTRWLLPVLERVRESREYQELEASGTEMEPSCLVLSLEEAREHPPIVLDMTEDAVILDDPAGTLARELQAVRERMRAWGSVKRHLPDGGWYWVLKPDQQPGEIIEL